MEGRREGQVKDGRNEPKVEGEADDLREGEDEGKDEVEVEGESWD